MQKVNLSYMDLIIDKICTYFNIDKEKVIAKSNKQDVSIVRNYIYYILHYEYNFSIGNIAKKFGRCRREINYRVSEIKYRIEYFPFNKQEYQEIIDNLNKKKEVDY